MHARSPARRGVFVWALVGLGVVLSITLRHGFLLTASGDLIQCLLLCCVLLGFAGNVTRAQHRTRLFWLLMALSCAMWLCAQLLWTYFEVWLRREVPNPFVADVAFFLHLVPVMGALAIRPDIERHHPLA